MRVLSPQIAISVASGHVKAVNTANSEDRHSVGSLSQRVSRLYKATLRPEAIPMLYLLAGQFIEALKEKRRAEHAAPKLEVVPMVARRFMEKWAIRLLNLGLGGAFLLGIPVTMAGEEFLGWRPSAMPDWMGSLEIGLLVVAAMGLVLWMLASRLTPKHSSTTSRKTTTRS